MGRGETKDQGSDLIARVTAMTLDNEDKALAGVLDGVLAASDAGDLDAFDDFGSTYSLIFEEPSAPAVHLLFRADDGDSSTAELVSAYRDGQPITGLKLSGAHSLTFQTPDGQLEILFRCDPRRPQQSVTIVAVYLDGEHYLGNASTAAAKRLIETTLNSEWHAEFLWGLG